MAELYPDPDPAEEAVPKVQELCEIRFLEEEERLLRLHRMLEICSLQHEREVQIYQAAHRDLVKDEGEFIRMLAVPNVPQRALKEWEKHVSQNMRGDRSKMRRSRQRTTALLRAIKYTEGQRQHMARMAVNAEEADQINDEPPMQALMGDDAVHQGVGQIEE
ncbi:MAG: hypothetical protein Q9182_003951 [Xanthomendoza sp. 2 TL-2023]